MGNAGIVPLVKFETAPYVTLTAKKIKLLDPRILSTKFDLLTNNFAQPYNEKIKITIPLANGQLDVVSSKVDYSAYLLPIYLKAGRAAHIAHYSHADTIEAFAEEVGFGKTNRLWLDWAVKDHYSDGYPQYLFMEISKDDKPILMLLNCIAFKQAYVKRAAIEFKENPGNMPRNVAEDFVAGLIAEAKAQAKKMEGPFNKAMQDFESLKNFLKEKGFKLELEI